MVSLSALLLLCSSSIAPSVALFRTISWESCSTSNQISSGSPSLRLAFVLPFPFLPSFSLVSTVSSCHPSFDLRISASNPSSTFSTSILLRPFSPITSAHSIHSFNPQRPQIPTYPPFLASPISYDFFRTSIPPVVPPHLPRTTCCSPLSSSLSALDVRASCFWLADDFITLLFLPSIYSLFLPISFCDSACAHAVPSMCSIDGQSLPKLSRTCHLPLCLFSLPYPVGSVSGVIHFPWT